LVVVDQLAHQVAVHNLNDQVAARDDIDVIPVVDLDEVLELRAIAYRPDIRRLLAVRNNVDLTAQRQKPAAALFVNLAGVLLARVDIGLVALHDPLRNVRKLYAAVLYAAVSGVGARDAVLQLQLEIRGLAAAPDAKNVLRGLMLGSGFSRDRSVFDSPEG